jgi:hypothetical protein
VRGGTRHKPEGPGQEKKRNGEFQPEADAPH